MLNYQAGRFPQFSSLSLWTQGPQFCLLPFVCPRTPRRCLTCSEIWVVPGIGLMSCPWVTSPQCLPPLPQLGGTSQLASSVQPCSILTRRPPGTQAPSSWYPLEAKPGEWPSSLQPCSTLHPPVLAWALSALARGLGPALQALCSARSRGWSLPPHPALLGSSFFTAPFSVVGPASRAPDSDNCCS